jgi:hypothetical protein
VRVLITLFVREFYLANTGFFLLVIAFAGGFMRSHDHHALAEFFISSPFVSMIPIAIWVLYTLKAMAFNFEIFNQKENQFIFCFMLLPVLKKWRMAISVSAFQLLPVCIYGLFLCLVATKYCMLLSTLTIVISCVLLISTAAYHFIWWAHHPNHEKKVLFLSRILNRRITKPFSSFFIEWLIRNKLFLFIGIKVFSGLIIIGITELFKTDTYDLRLLGFGILISGAANTNIVVLLHRFENFHLQWVKALPLSLLKRISVSLLSIAILCLPEVILLIKNFPENRMWHDYIISTVFLFSIPILFYGLLYVKDRTQEEITPIVFYYVIGWFVLVLFNVPMLLLGIVNTVAGLFLWKKFFYSFEYIARKTSPAIRQGYFPNDSTL